MFETNNFGHCDKEYPKKNSRKFQIFQIYLYFTNFNIALAYKTQETHVGSLAILGAK